MLKIQKIFLLILTASLFGSCVSINKYNSNLNALRNEKQLKSDVDFVYEKLQKLHPRLNWYISKQDLDNKFDSLKSSINAAMTSNDFFLKLSPVIASVRQGHMRLFPLTKKKKIKEMISMGKSGTSPLSQFDFERFNDKLYIVKNISGDKNIKTGTEVISVNNIKPQELISKYRRTISSDGFNQTFIERRLSKDFPTYFYYQNDLTDSILCQFKYNDTIKYICLKRSPANISGRNAKTAKPGAFEKQRQEQEKDKRKELGFNAVTKTFSKNLSFVEPDSSIAILKINDFSKGNFQTFYSKTFKLLDSLKTTTLILDLRDNPGGETQDVRDLYSYLTDHDFVFMDKAELVSRTSILHTNYFQRNSLLINAILAVLYPLELISKGITYLMVEKRADNKYYLHLPESMSIHSKHNHFKGDIYVLINGGTFSASCILASNLKGAKRAVFVGEETGGAFNGTIAGKMTVFTLPGSKLLVAFGLAAIDPYYKTAIEGRGIFPDIEIKPTLADRINGNDPEIKWVLDDVKGRHATIGPMR